ncbi:hypothetical protein ACJ41O_001763 [Fusarium nematophilum]
MSLSQIPREVRQKIFDLAIRSPPAPLASPSVSQQGRHKQAGARFRGRGVWHLKPQNPALGLLLVNKQFNAEVQHVLDHIPTIYHLDVMFVKEYGLWPTWHIPVLPRTQYVDSINATFRIFDPTDDLDPRFQRSLSFTRGDGAPEPAVWAFYRLLTAVLASGPGYLRDNEDGYIVKEINVNVLAPTDGASHESIVLSDQQLPAGEKERRRRYTAMALFDNDSFTPEERLAKYMTEKLSSILRLSYHTMSYGMTLWENLAERVVFTVNGTEYRRFELEEFIDKYKVDYWGETPEYIVERKAEYQVWRQWVDERRQRIKQGLEIAGERPVDHIM